jgi:uncharacterized protein (DUF1697 family)
MSRYVVLLRGINVGSRRRVAMADLRGLISSAGYGDVRTHLQSGNVLLDSDSSPAALSADLERQLLDGLGMELRVVVRSREELADVIARDPLAGVVDDPKRYQVSFLSDALDERRTRELGVADLAPELLVLSGREIFSWHPQGIHASKLAKLLTDQRLGVTVTARNWNTVIALHELARGSSL